MVVMLLLVIMTLALFAFFIWKLTMFHAWITDITEKTPKNLAYPEKISTIIKNPAFFRTLEMQTQLMIHLKILDKPGFSNETKFQATFNGSTENREKRAAETDVIFGTVNHHACCTSRHMSVAPNTAINVVGVSRKLVQFPGSKQYFLTEDCIHNHGCAIPCHCDQPDPFLYLAIVYSNTANGALRFETDQIEILGSCKCMN